MRNATRAHSSRSILDLVTVPTVEWVSARGLRARSKSRGKPSITSTSGFHDTRNCRAYATRRHNACPPHNRRMQRGLPGTGQPVNDDHPVAGFYIDFLDVVSGAAATISLPLVKQHAGGEALGQSGLAARNWLSARRPSKQPYDSSLGVDSRADQTRARLVQLHSHSIQFQLQLYDVPAIPIALLVRDQNVTI